MDIEEKNNKNKNTEAVYTQSDEHACCTDCQDTDQDGQPDVEYENVAALDAALGECQKEVLAWKEQCVRLKADIENMQRRMYKDQEQAVMRVKGDIFAALLSIMDNFDRADGDLHKLAQHAEWQPVINGFGLIKKDLVSLFDRYQIQEMPHKKQFDPLWHEALVSVNDPARESGDIVSVLQKGYLCKDAVLRHAKVSVNQ